MFAVTIGIFGFETCAYTPTQVLGLHEGMLSSTLILFVLCWLELSYCLYKIVFDFYPCCGSSVSVYYVGVFG